MLQIYDIAVSSLNPWVGNPRVNDHAVDCVAHSIQTFGFNVPIICDQNMTIIAGHTRWKAAQKLELTTVPVIILEMTDVERSAFSVADNKTAELADWDWPKLRDVLTELNKEALDLNGIGFTDEEIRRLLGCVGQDENELPDITCNPQTRFGDQITLGSHRLMCGDSRNGEMINSLLEGATIDHIFAGPPYYNQRSYVHWERYDEYLSDMKDIINNCRDVLKDGSILVWNIANESSSYRDLTSQHSLLLERSGLRYLDTVIWVKRGANYTIPRNLHIHRTRCYYPAHQWEALLVFQKSGNMPKMSRDGAKYMSHYHTDVWEIQAVTNQIEIYGHPAVCPVEIPLRCIQAYTKENASVFEPFGGSGTTLIAAEKAGRHAYIMEQNPVYCDLIVKRWETMTTHKALR